MILIHNNNDYEYYKDYLLKSDIEYLNTKLATLPWRQVEYFKNNRGKITTPRFTWVSGGYETIYNQHPEWILPLLEYTRNVFSNDFNYILYAKYTSTKHSIAPHSDDEFFLGSSPKIAILNVGESINFNLINKTNKTKTSFTFKNNDLILMKNNCQKNFNHEIPKGNQIDSVRYSLSFRRVIHPYGDVNYNKYN